MRATAEWSKADWKALSERGAPSYLFHCSKPSSSIPRRILEYIRWGETECKTKTGDVCSESQACKERARDIKNYKGWYDVGAVREAQVFTSRYAQYSRRFGLLDFKCALDDDLIVFKQKRKFSENQLKALLAYLNSSIGQFYIELRGRTTGGGMVALEAEEAGNIPIPDLRKLSSSEVGNLAKLFEELEREARRIGGADTRLKLKALHGIIRQIDQLISQIIGLTERDMKEVRNIVELMMNRRIARAEEAKPESIGGERPRVRPPDRKEKVSEDRLTPPLGRWS